MYPEDMGVRVLLSESVAVFNGNLGFPVEYISEISNLIAGHTYPTPPIPASATRLCTLNCSSISVIIFSRPRNFGSFSNGTVKHTFADVDS